MDDHTIGYLPPGQAIVKDLVDDQRDVPPAATQLTHLRQHFLEQGAFEEQDVALSTPEADEEQHAHQQFPSSIRAVKGGLPPAITPAPSKPEVG
jgi:hypothetical protein